MKNVLADKYGLEKRWVNWKLETRGGKQTKVPYKPGTNLKASSTDSKTWATHDEASRHGDNVGIVFTPDQNLLGIDIDHCVEYGKIVHAEAKSIRALLSVANTYTEISPSGSGLHLYFALNEPLSLVANKKAPFEVYTSGRYFTTTGIAFGVVKAVRTISPAEALEFLALIGYPWGKDESPVPALGTSEPPRLDDQVLLEKMFSSRIGVSIRALYDGDTSEYGGDASSADMALLSHLAFWTAKNAGQMERLWLSSPLALRPKTQKREDYRKRSITNAIKNCTETYTAPANKPDSGTPKEKPHLWTTGEILEQEFGDEEWLVDRLITKSGLTAFSGNPGDYKSFTTIHIALCMVRKTLVFGKFPVASGSVLIIDEEDHIRLVQGRLKSLGVTDSDSIYYLSQSGVKVDNEDSRKFILEVIKEKDIKLVILDSLVRIHEQDENDAKSMAKVFGCIQQIIKAGTSVLFTHHHRKQYGFGNSNPGQNMRGSSDILAAVDSHITIRKKKDEPDRLIVEQTKSRQAEALPSFELKIIKNEIGPAGFEYTGDYDEKKAKTEEATAAILIILQEGLKSRPDLQQALKEEFGRDVIDSAIKATVEAGDVEKVPRTEVPPNGGKKAYYRLSQAKKLTTSPHDGGHLPVSETLIETGTQEDADRVFEQL